MVTARQNGTDRSGRDAAIVVFARGARGEGRCKWIGLDPAARADAATSLLERTLEVARGSGADLLLAGDADLERAPAPRIRFLRQRGRGFGQRLRHAVEDAFGLGYRRVVVIGTDTPALTSALCRQALDVLGSGRPTDVVIGPSRDGGYYLIGFNRFDERAFRGIAWNTRRVLAQTARALAGCRLVRLPVLTDADDAGSLRGAVAEALRCGTGGTLARLIERLALRVRENRTISLPVTPPVFLLPVRRGPPPVQQPSLGET